MAYASGRDGLAETRVGERAIHLAGEHTVALAGYMEGALRSGLAAARRIDAAGGG
jgi:monoamine oxidase